MLSAASKRLAIYTIPRNPSEADLSDLSDSSDLSDLSDLCEGLGVQEFYGAEVVICEFKALFRRL